MSSWIEEGVELHPEDKPGLVFRVTRVRETGNGTRMVSMESVDDPNITCSKWEPYLLRGDPSIFAALDGKSKRWVKAEMAPVPVTDTSKTRYELLDSFDEGGSTTPT